MKRLLLVGALVLALSLTACEDGGGGGTPEGSPGGGTTEDVDDGGESPSDVADAYALELSGGEREGCSSAAPGPESESNPGCIYGVAFAGCYEGLTGEQLSPLSVEEEFPDEPALQALYDRAVRECREGD